MEAQDNKHDDLNNLKLENTQQVPQGYFEQFTAKLMHRLQQTNEVTEETGIVAPLLNTISKEPPFAVPDGYFPAFNDSIHHRINKKPSGILAPLRRHWAIAASTIGMIIIGSLYFLSNSSPDLLSDKGLEKHISKMSNEQLEHFLDTENGVTNNTNAITGDSGTVAVDFAQAFRPVSDHELQQFLAESAGEE